MSQESMQFHDRFLFTLDWLLAVTRRYSGHLRFGLVHISFANPAVLGETFGAQGAAMKLDEALSTLRTAFRRTDLVTRDGTDFWIVVPYTPTDGKLADKIREILAVASQTELTIVERDVSFFSLPFDTPELNPDCSAAEFLTYLKKNHLRLADHEISLTPEEQ